MMLQRFAELLEAYGGDSNRWPEDEQKAALELLAANPQARDMLEESLAFDRLLDAHKVPHTSTLHLSKSIQAHIQSRFNPIDQFVRWLFPDLSTLQAAIRPAAVACLPLLMGVMIGYVDTTVYNTVYNTTEELSMDEEFALLAMTYQTESLYTEEQNYEP